jgi:hypothetical protein
MKNRSTIQTLTFVQTNPDHLYMKLLVVHAIIHSFGSKRLAPCKNFSWLLTFKTGTWKWHLAIFLVPTFREPEQPLSIAIKWQFDLACQVCRFLECGPRAPITFKLEGEVTSLSESSQGEVGDNREKWGDFWEKILQLIETLFRDASDVALPKFSK